MKSRCCEVSFEAGKLHLFYLKDKAACHERCSHTVIITYCLRTITPLVGRIGLKLFFFFFSKSVRVEKKCMLITEHVYVDVYFVLPWSRLWPLQLWSIRNFLWIKPHLSLLFRHISVVCTRNRLCVENIFFQSGVGFFCFYFF